MTRETTTSRASYSATCLGCGWKSSAVNAMGNAARHHDATGHPVTVDTARTVFFGDPDTPHPGQTTIDQALADAQT